MGGSIDIVCNLFTPDEVRNGQTGLDDDFKSQVRMADAMRDGVTIPDYLAKMDRAAFGVFGHGNILKRVMTAPVSRMGPI